MYMTKKNELGLRVRYEPPEAELIKLGKQLRLLASFSLQGGMDDWNEGDLLEEELGEEGGASDWGNGGGLGHD